MNKHDDDYTLMLLLIEYEVTGTWWLPFLFCEKAQNWASNYIYRKTVKKYNRLKKYRSDVIKKKMEILIEQQ